MFVSANAFTIHLVIRWIGYIYMKTKLPHESNIQILNSLNEGIFIVSPKDDREIIFENSAAKRVNKKLSSCCGTTLYANK